MSHVFGKNLTPKTIFPIVFAGVKYKLNTDQAMQLTLAMTRRIYWDVYLILTKNHMTSKACDTINCEPDRADYCSFLLVHVFAVDLCSALTTQPSDSISWTCSVENVCPPHTNDHHSTSPSLYTYILYIHPHNSHLIINNLHVFSRTFVSLFVSLQSLHLSLESIYGDDEHRLTCDRRQWAVTRRCSVLLSV